MIMTKPRTKFIDYDARNVDGVEPCVVCGRRVKEPRYFLHVVNGGTHALHPEDEDKYEADGGEMGMQIIGPNCRRKHDFTEWTHD